MILFSLPVFSNSEFYEAIGAQVEKALHLLKLALAEFRDVLSFCFLFSFECFFLLVAFLCLYDVGLNVNRVSFFLSLLRLRLLFFSRLLCLVFC